MNMLNYKFIYCKSFFVWPPPLWMHFVVFAHAQNKPGVVPHPSRNALTMFNYLVFKLRKCDRLVAIQPCICQLRRSQGWPIRDWLGPESHEGPVKGVWHDQLANSSLPYCRYAGIVFMEERNVSNSLINLQYLWVKDFIYIALVCKWPLYYYAN